MDKPQPYRGDEPYVFVCYAHADADTVYPEIRWLQEQGVRIWYDEGISAGKVWRAEIGEAIERAETVLFYISTASLHSDHCNREVSVALDDDKTILPVYLEDVPLTPDLKVGLARLQAVHRTNDGDYQRHLVEALGRTAPVNADLPSAKQPPLLPKFAVIFGLIVVLAGTGWWYFQKQGSERPVSAGVAVQAHKPTIAVLSFDNLSNDIEQEFFSEGIAEDVLNGLAHSSGVVVRGRNSSFSFKGQQVDTKTIAEHLRVTHIVSGSVRASGSRVRVNARLTAVEQDVDVWSERYDRELIDVFAVQDEITESILNALDLHFSGSKRRRVSPDAYNSFLMGRYLNNRFETAKAIFSLENAIEIEPGYAEALSTLADVYQTQEWFGASSGNDVRENSRDNQRAYLERALKVDPNEPLARGLQANAVWFDPQDAINELNHLVHQYPNNPDLHFFYSAVLRRIGRFDLELRVLDQMVALDPLSVSALSPRGGAKLFNGSYPEAAEDFQAAERLGIQMARGFSWSAFYRRDIEALEQQVHRGPAAWGLFPQFRTIMAAAVPYLRGDTPGVQQALSPLVANGGYTSNYVKFYIALLKAKNQLALDHFRAALREGEPIAFSEIQGSDGLRSLFPEYFAQPGYEAMLREFDLDSESVAKLEIPDLPF